MYFEKNIFYFLLINFFFLACSNLSIQKHKYNDVNTADSNQDTVTLSSESNISSTKTTDTIPKILTETIYDTRIKFSDERYAIANYDFGESRSITFSIMDCKFTFNSFYSQNEISEYPKDYFVNKDTILVVACYMTNIFPFVFSERGYINIDKGITTPQITITQHNCFNIHFHTAGPFFFIHPKINSKYNAPKKLEITNTETNELTFLTRDMADDYLYYSSEDSIFAFELSDSINNLPFDHAGQSVIPTAGITKTIFDIYVNDKHKVFIIQLYSDEDQENMPKMDE